MEVMSVYPNQLFNEHDLSIIKNQLEHPVEIQKDLASKLSIVLNRMIDEDLRRYGFRGMNWIPVLE